MHCRRCGYALWNLPSPRCPECGDAFDLRIYRFQPGTIGFACPRCHHLHGGAGVQHIPAETTHAACQGCGQVIDVREMSVVPFVSDLRKAEAVVGDLLPWEGRAQVGRWRAFWSTCGLAWGGPGRLGARVGPTSRWLEAYGFAVTLHMIAMLGYAGSCSCCIGVSSQGHGPELLWAVMWLVGGVFWAFVMPLLEAGVIGGAAHLFLRLSGATRLGFGGTAATVLYTHAPMLFVGIPCCGGYLSGPMIIWSLVASLFAVSRSQAVDSWRAACAVLWLPLLCATGFAMFIAVWVMIIGEQL